MRLVLCSLVLVGCSAAARIDTDASTSSEDAFSSSPADASAGDDANVSVDDAASASTDGGAPACLQDLIGTLSGEPPGNPAYSIHECTYRGQTVYYLPAQCCDQYSGLLDASCQVICAPDGGFTGHGDGRCADFDGTTCRPLWVDPRGP